MVSPLYGQTDAGAIWNETWDSHMQSEAAGYRTSEASPCVYVRRVGPNGEDQVQIVRRFVKRLKRARRIEQCLGIASCSHRFGVSAPCRGLRLDDPHL